MKFKFVKYTYAQLQQPEVRRYFRTAAAARKLARIDWTRFRPARFLAEEENDFAKIPAAFVRFYVREYQKLSRGRV